MRSIIGIDVRIDARARLQPWRMVLTTAERVWDRSEHLMRLPGGVLYLTPPNHHVHGNLLELPCTRDQALSEIASRLRRKGASSAYAASAHVGGLVEDMLAWHGVNLLPVDVEFPDDGTLDNPHGIGEGAGHEIAAIAKHLEKAR